MTCPVRTCADADAMTRKIESLVSVQARKMPASLHATRESRVSPGLCTKLMSR
jgi:hypothetical protein